MIRLTLYNASADIGTQETNIRYFAPKSIDIKPSLVVRALFAPSLGRHQAKSETIVALSQDKHVVSGTSVRSLFAAYLMSQPEGTSRQAIFTAITLGDMAEVARASGYAVKSIRIDPPTQQPNVKDLDKLLKKNPDSIVIFTPLFGAIVDYSAAMKLCRKYGATVAIDNAQGFRGLEFRDYDDYDVMFWSFGPIKTMTSLGGGIALLNNSGSAASLKAAIQEFPRSSMFGFRLRLVKYLVLSGLSRPRGFTLLLHTLQALRLDAAKIMDGSVKGYSAKRDLLTQVKKRPNRLQQKLFYLQLKSYEIETIPRRSAYGQLALGRLGAEKFLGTDTVAHSFWLMPYLSDSVEKLLISLHAQGYYASSQTSALELIDDSHTELKDKFKQVIYLPVDHTLSAHELGRLIEIVESHQK